MSERATAHSELLLLCGKVRDNALTPADSARLDELLQASDQAKALYVQYMSVVSLLESRGQAEQQLTETNDAEDGINADVFAQLLELENQAHAELVHHVGHLRSRPALPLMLTHAAHGIVRSPGVLSAVAAVFVLAVILVFVFSGDADEPGSIADQLAPQTEQGPTGPALSNTVATLTDQQDAVWQTSAATASAATEKPQPGTELTPGQRLTLTQGFAQITTHRGAIAILEAPATIELTDSDNALRLHRGKLVGICETESSKGFTVYTPHMDITDLGTRFGVDASREDQTQVHVFEGEVRAARAGVKPILLVANEAAHASAQASSMDPIASDPMRFASIHGQTALVPRTPKTVIDTDTRGNDWLIMASEWPGSVRYLGKQVVCNVQNIGFGRTVSKGNAYGFIEHRHEGAGLGKPATKTGTWTFSNLPAGRYEVATAFNTKGADAVRYTVNGQAVIVDQSIRPAKTAGPAFTGGIKDRYLPRDHDIQFIMLNPAINVREGGTITVTIDNANVSENDHVLLDSVAIRLISMVPEGNP